MSKHWGVVKLSVQKMKERGFEFDEPRNGSVHVVNMPFYRREDLDAANEKTMRIRECIVGFIPPELVRVRDVMPKSTHL